MPRLSLPSLPNCLAALPGRLNLGRVHLVGTGRYHLRDAWEGVVGRENAGAGEGIGRRRRTRACGDAALRAGTPVVGRVHQLDRPTGAVGRNMQRGRVGEGHAAIAAHSRKRGRTDREVDVPHLERHRRR